MVKPVSATRNKQQASELQCVNSFPPRLPSVVASSSSSSSHIQAAAKARAAAAPKTEEPEEDEEPAIEVPEGFEMVDINGRMVMRMK